MARKFIWLERHRNMPRLWVSLFPISFLSLPLPLPQKRKKTKKKSQREAYTTLKCSGNV